MGKIMLVVVLLVGAIYAGIMLRMQNKLLELPQIKIQMLAEKQAENVSDFALRSAVRNSVQLGLQASPGTITQLTQRFNNYRIGDSVLDSISYVFTGVQGQYRAISYVRSNVMGTLVDYPAEIAFQFPVAALLSPDAFYLEMDQPQFNPSPNFNHVIDTTPNHNHGLFWGDVSTRPMGQGANGWKCASFGSGGGWIDFPGSASTQVSSNYSVICFAKIREGHQNATLVWVASDPYDTGSPTPGHPGQNLRYKPTAGIWFTGGQIHFSAVNTAYVQSTVSVPFTPSGRWPHNRDQWVFFGMTYNNGLLNAYINGQLVGSNNSAYPLPAIRSTYGFSLGRKDIRTLGPGGNAEYMYMFGLMDQVGLYRRTLTHGEMQGIYDDILAPATLQYIKD